MNTGLEASATVEARGAILVAMSAQDPPEASLGTEKLPGMSIGFWAEFVSPETEIAFLEYSRKHRILMTLLAVWASTLEALLFIPSDRRILGASPLVESLLHARIAFSLVSVVVLTALWAGAQTSIMTRLLLAWAFGAMLLEQYVGYSRPSLFFLGWAITSLFSLLNVYFIMPLHFRWQLLLASIETVLVMTLASLHPDINPLIVRAYTSTYLLTHIVSAVAAYSLHRLRRKQYVALKEEAALRENLESMIAEVRTLRGILPICSYCKKIRNDHGDWETLDVYVKDHTDTEFSHGICPECIQTHFQGYARRPRSESRPIQ